MSGFPNWLDDRKQGPRANGASKPERKYPWRYIEKHEILNFYPCNDYFSVDAYSCDIEGKREVVATQLAGLARVRITRVRFSNPPIKGDTGRTMGTSIEMLGVMLREGNFVLCEEHSGHQGVVRRGGDVRDLLPRNSLEDYLITCHIAGGAEGAR